jgi:organic radical activating enzyme
MNQQPIEKRVDQRPDKLLDVHSIFHTIQGEGPFCGTPAVFVRLAGCNLQCPACDTEYTQGRQLQSVADICQYILGLVTMSETRLVVITGGEPFRQDLTELLKQLVRLGFFVQIETNGSYAPPPAIMFSLDPGLRNGVYIVCSPKTGKLNPHVWELACAVKYVISFDSYRQEDGLPTFALGHSANPYVARPPEGWSRPIYLQPMDAHDDWTNKANMRAAVRSCMEHGYILQLQVHKIIGVD